MPTRPLSFMTHVGRNACSHESASGEVAAHEMPTTDRHQRRTIDTQMIQLVMMTDGRCFFSLPIMSSMSGIVETPLSE